jgi:hypothetical protein
VSFPQVLDSHFGSHIDYLSRPQFSQYEESSTPSPGESNIRHWLIENDWLEAIVALPVVDVLPIRVATA